MLIKELRDLIADFPEDMEVSGKLGWKSEAAVREMPRDGKVFTWAQIKPDNHSWDGFEPMTDELMAKEIYTLLDVLQDSGRPEKWANRVFWYNGDPGYYHNYGGSPSCCTTKIDPRAYQACIDGGWIVEFGEGFMKSGAWRITDAGHKKFRQLARSNGKTEAV